MAVIRSIDDLLYVFRDGQPPKSIGPEDWQDMIASLHPSTGNFQDLPSSPTGLAQGRVWLNGDVLTVVGAGGTSGGQSQASYRGGGVGSFRGVSTQRLAARALLAGVGGVAGAAQLGALFYDGFDTLSMYNQFASVPGTWYPSDFWSPANQGKVIGHTWILNPFNPATPISGAYSVANSQLRLLMQSTPAPYLAACSNQPYIGQNLALISNVTFGRFSARLAVPSLNGTNCAFFLISNSGGASPVTTEINLEIVTGATWSPRTEWQFAIPPPGYPPGVGPVAEWHSYYPGSPNIDITQFNVFTFDVRPTTVSCEINGIEVMRATPPPEWGQNPWIVYFGQGDGGDWTGPLDASPAYAPYLVDYFQITA